MTLLAFLTGLIALLLAASALDHHLHTRSPRYRRALLWLLGPAEDDEPTFTPISHVRAISPHDLDRETLR
jgi:hypothetical protein